jgi:hypothetical protein
MIHLHLVGKPTSTSSIKLYIKRIKKPGRFFHIRAGFDTASCSWFIPRTPAKLGPFNGGGHLSIDFDCFCTFF